MYFCMYVYIHEYPQCSSILHQPHILHSKLNMVQVWRWLQTAADEAVASPSSGQRKDEVTKLGLAGSSEMDRSGGFLVE